MPVLHPPAPRTRRRLAAALACVLALAPFAAPRRAEAGWGLTGIPATRAPRAQYRPVAVSDGAGGMLLAWLDHRSGYNVDVYAQRVLPVGSIGTNWSPDGNALTHVTCTKFDLALASDGAGGAIAWRGPTCAAPAAASPRVLPARARASGAPDPAWPVDARALCSATALQDKPAIASRMARAGPS